MKPPVRPSVSSPVLIACVGLAALCASGCDAFEPAPFEPQYVVEAYLAAREPLPQVRLSTTAPIEGVYDFSRQAVRGAVVRIHLLAEGGAVEATYAYEELPSQPGVYMPSRFRHVLPRRTYALDVAFPDRPDRITAQTTVPGPVALGEVNPDTVVYQSSEAFVLRVRHYPEAERQSYFRFSTVALDARVEQLTPFARDLYDRGSVTIDEMRRGTSPILNEGNYEIENDSVVVIRYPWFGVLFYGPSHVSASALDDNLYDFVRSQSVQQGGSTLSPGEIPNVLDHVDGGTGIFGSYARATFGVYVARNPDLER